ncbi:hypothetical protein [Granulicella mallensis]|uniref:Adenylate cyclase n=1 Tax=Granulicella mallensis (strain ATCC BAA-1857 / DSM 23137 / MP5ACTX8) TaxID=682795 RepID=G8NX41_GRAMM|nr:hypothetical protein [Granulicella mallensis]AEU36655.1 hypothetical protein AciX8_2338 [Granulicella mallensis MP5ACTX8]
MKDRSSYKPSNPGLSKDARWLLAQRLVANKNFAKSPFLTNFLLYVCDRELSGRADEITEYQIGIQAFGRPVDYNPGVDNVVRNYARVLRKRLDQYFETDGKNEPIRISIPVGRYVPIFHESAQAAGDGMPVQPPQAPREEVEIKKQVQEKAGNPSMPERRGSHRLLLGVVFALVGAVLVIGFLGIHFFKRRPATLSHQLWTQLFRKDRQTLVVPADSGLGILENLTRRPVRLSEYVTGSYLSHEDAMDHVDANNLNDLRNQRYTSVADLNIALSLSHVPELVQELFAIRYARDLRMDDLKQSNVILLGSVHTNPWVELFEKKLNFALQYSSEVDDSIVVNRRPGTGESAVYQNGHAEDPQRTYAIVAFVPSLDGKGHALLLEGLNMAGTQAASDFFLSEKAMEPILQKARGSDGSIRPFEILLETSSIGANAPESRVIAERYADGIY